MYINISYVQVKIGLHNVRVMCVSVVQDRAVPSHS